MPQPGEARWRRTLLHPVGFCKDSIRNDPEKKKEETEKASYPLPHLGAVFRAGRRIIPTGSLRGHGSREKGGPAGALQGETAREGEGERGREGRMEGCVSYCSLSFKHGHSVRKHWILGGTCSGMCSLI